MEKVVPKHLKVTELQNIYGGFASKTPSTGVTENKYLSI